MEPSTALLALQPRQVIAALRRQGFAFWALNFYLFVEYVRPQSVWPAIDVLPWGQVALAVSVASILGEPAVKRSLGLLDGLLVAFSIILIASLVGAYDVSYGLRNVQTFLNWLIFYYLVTRIVTTEARMLLLVSAFFLWSLKMSQFGTRAFISTGFRFRDWGTGGGPGWFQNSGEFAIQMVVFLAMSLHVILGLRDRWPRWKTYLLLAALPGTALIGIIMSSSRGGQLAAVGVLALMVAKSRHRVRGFAWAIVLIPSLWLVMPPEQKARFSEMGDDGTSQTRLTYWRHGLEIMRDRPILGVGYSNWLPYYQTYYNPSGQVSHNIFIEAGSELGYLGLTAFVLLIAATFTVNARTRRMARLLPAWGRFHGSLADGLDAALVGYLIAGFFVTVLYYPFFWVNLAFASALHLIVARRYSARLREERALRRAARGPAGQHGMLVQA